MVVVWPRVGLDEHMPVQLPSRMSMNMLPQETHVYGSGVTKGGPGWARACPTPK